MESMINSPIPRQENSDSFHQSRRDSSGRMHGYDNLKGLLILSVVLGHLLEISGGFRGIEFLYRTIYYFHIPAFLFLAGLFYKQRPVLKKIYGYLVFQTLYLVFDYTVSGGKTLVLQYTTPYWILWYMLVLIYYHVSAPLFLDKPLKKQFILFLLSIAAALLAGLDKTVGYYLSLSRALVFAPFFILGLMLNPYKLSLQERLYDLGKKRTLIGLALLIVLCILTLLAWQSHRITTEMLYGSFSYAARSYHMGIRLFQLFLAFLWICFFVFAQASFDFRIPCLTQMGRHTLPVFLLHGFFIKYAGAHSWFRSGGLGGLCLLLFTCFALTMLLGSKAVHAVFSKLFS